MWDFPLNQISIKLYAIAHYSNGNGTWNEFFSSIKNCNIIYRLISTSYEKEISINSIINSIIKLGNMFQGKALGRILLVQSPKNLRSDIKTYLHFLSRLPNEIPEYDLSDVPLNDTLLKKLMRL